MISVVVCCLICLSCLWCITLLYMIKQIVPRWWWSFWSGQEDWPGTNYGPSPAAGQGIPADSGGCWPAGQPQCSCCHLCGCWTPATTVYQCLLHYCNTRKHPWRTTVSLNTFIHWNPLQDIYMKQYTWHWLHTHTHLLFSFHYTMINIHDEKYYYVSKTTQSWWAFK